MMAMVYSAPACEPIGVREVTLLCASSVGSYSYSSNSYKHKDDDSDGNSDRSSWSDSFDPTRNYYGKHGEFDSNDESRRVSEDMQQFHANYPEVELTDHYDWHDELEAETDGYLDD